MTTYLTDQENEAIQHLHRKAPYLIRGVSYGFFSVARYYGGATYQGESYTYNPATDELVRDDVLKFVEKARRAATKEAKAKVKAKADIGATLFDEPPMRG